MVKGLGINSKYLDSSSPGKALVELSNVVETTRLTQTPTFIEIDTFRFLEHCGPTEDDHLGYREPAYIVNAKRNDPLLMVSLELVGLIKEWDKIVAEMTKVIDEEIEMACDFARNSDYPDSLLEGTSAYAGKKL
jgi:pyruvate dehydrogenase E1 component alpha subunit